jgi:DNA-binding transcriptional LysR family regulator
MERAFRQLQSLNLPLPVVSRRVADLDAYLRAKLVLRTNRKLQLTDAGATFVPSAQRVLEELAEAERTAMGECRAPSGELLTTAPIESGSSTLRRSFKSFLPRIPKMTVWLVLSDGIVDLLDHRVDVAMASGLS